MKTTIGFKKILGVSFWTFRKLTNSQKIMLLKQFTDGKHLQQGTREGTEEEWL